jgi:hypothetical protein
VNPAAVERVAVDAQPRAHLGCQTVADLGPCNANLTGAVQPPNNTPPNPPKLLDVEPH